MPMSKTKELFCTFFKIGAFTFGGGYAMVPPAQQAPQAQGGKL